MNPPPTSLPIHLSGSSPCTSPKHAAPYVRHGLARIRDLFVFPFEFKRAPFFSHQSGGLQMNHVVPESPGRIVTLQRQRRGKCKLLSFLFVLWENGIEACILSCKKRIASLGPMEDTACLGLVYGDDPESCYREGGGRGVHVWERM